MSFSDEEILKARHAIKEAEKQEKENRTSKENLEAELKESILGGKVHIYGEEVEFSRRRNEEYGVSMMMPTTSFDMDDKLKETIYPMESRPKYVYGNATVNLVVSLNLTTSRIPEDKIEPFLDYAEKLIKATGPKVTHIKKKMIHKEKCRIGVMEFISTAMDTKVYNTTFYAVVKEQLLIGNINFPIAYRERQLKIVKEMLESFEIEETEA